MLVQANEVDYDYNNSRVSAVGNVQMFYNGTGVEADKVIYDQKTKRLHAEGNIRMTDADGKITYANILDLSDDYRDGFVDLLRVDTADETRMAATRADRTKGNYTVFENGVYTACAPCKDDPKKPPLWQVKGARIIHNQTEKMLYFEDARLEFLRRAYGVYALFLHARSDREAQERLSDTVCDFEYFLWGRDRSPLLFRARAELRPDHFAALYHAAGRADAG